MFRVASVVLTTCNVLLPPPSLPLPAANSTHVLQTMVVGALSAAGVGMCKASLEELKYWQKHNFPHPVPAPSNPATIDFVDPVRDVTSQWAVVTRTCER